MKKMHFIKLFTLGAFTLYGSTAGAQSSNSGSWQLDTHQDALSGQTITVIGLVPTSDTDNDFDSTSIYIRCAQDKTLDFQVDWDQKMTTDSSTTSFEVDYRIGQNGIQSGNWPMSNDAEGLFYPDNVMTFLQQLESSNSFVAQVTPVGMEPISATYDTTGLSQAVIPVLKACGYDQPQS